MFRINLGFIIWSIIFLCTAIAAIIFASAVLGAFLLSIDWIFRSLGATPEFSMMISAFIYVLFIIFIIGKTLDEW